MAETIESVKETSTQTETLDPKIVQDALLRLRQLAEGLPPVDAAALIGDIREAGTRTIWARALALPMVNEGVQRSRRGIRFS